MTDNEIIKALECCYDLDSSAICHQCPLYQTENCRDGYLGLQALHLINRQKEEIERLKGMIRKNYDDYFQKVDEVATAKAEAIKEFAEMLKDKFSRQCTKGYCKVLHDFVNTVLKEMVGDNNG